MHNLSNQSNIVFGLVWNDFVEMWTGTSKDDGEKSTNVFEIQDFNNT